LKIQFNDLGLIQKNTKGDRQEGSGPAGLPKGVEEV
jgi:hypothetical protein